jgi:hypothetical protein
MRKISFKNWLCTQPHGKTPIGPEGDFIADARYEISAGRFPDVQDWQELKTYLRNAHACREAINAAASTWHHYNAKVPA